LFKSWKASAICWDMSPKRISIGLGAGRTFDIRDRSPAKTLKKQPFSREGFQKLIVLPRRLSKKSSFSREGFQFLRAGLSKGDDSAFDSGKVV
jgi:hypothetical protein